VTDDIVVRFEDAVREPVVAHRLPDVFNRTTGLSSGHFGGRARMVMLTGIATLLTGAALNLLRSPPMNQSKTDLGIVNES
jgi:hypothetical protein